MWADVGALGSGNDNRDAAAWWLWTGIGLTLGAHSYWSFSSLSFFRPWRDFVPCFRPCGASFFCYEYVWGTVYFISHFSYSLDIYVWGVLLNWIYLFNWDVTFMVSEQFVLRMTWGCGFVMPRGRKVLSLVEFISKTKGFKNRRRLDKVMRVQLMTRSKVVFPFLILMVWGSKGDKQRFGCL